MDDLEARGLNMHSSYNTFRNTGPRSIEWLEDLEARDLNDYFRNRAQGAAAKVGDTVAKAKGTAAQVKGAVVAKAGGTVAKAKGAAAQVKAKAKGAAAQVGSKLIMKRSIEELEERGMQRRRIRFTNM